jgi:hypothetical protein
MEKFHVSPVLNSFFIAELNNENDGGDSPSTFGTALDSLKQMPKDIFRDINPEMRSAYKKGDYENAGRELNSLIEKFGGGAPLEKFTTIPQISYFISYPAPSADEVSLWKLEETLEKTKGEVDSIYLNGGMYR